MKHHPVVPVKAHRRPLPVHRELDSALGYLSQKPLLLSECCSNGDVVKKDQNVRGSDYKGNSFWVSVRVCGVRQISDGWHQDELSGTGIALTYPRAGIAHSILYVAISFS